MATPAKKAAAPATPPADPFANLQAESVDKLFEGGGRPATPLPDSVVKMVEQSWNGGTDCKALRVAVADKTAAESLRKLLQKAGERHDPVITVRTTIEPDGKAIRFQAGPKVTRKAADANAA